MRPVVTGQLLPSGLEEEEGQEEKKELYSPLSTQLPFQGLRQNGSHACAPVLTCSFNMDIQPQIC